MTPRRLALAMVIVVVAAAVGVGAATPAGTAGADAAETPTTPTGANASAAPLGEAISMVMQANAAQTEGAVENGMWAAAFATAPNASAKRALAERRVGRLNGTLGELRAERRALQAAFRNGSIDQTAYRVQLSAIVGRLAALGEGIEETSERGATVGVNGSRLDQLRSQARTLGGAEVGQLARNLTGGQGTPGKSTVFGDESPGGAGEQGAGQSGNASDRPTKPGAPGDAGNATGGAGNTTGGDGGQGPPTDDQGQDEGEATATPTETES